MEILRLNFSLQMNKYLKLKCGVTKLIYAKLLLPVERSPIRHTIYATMTKLIVVVMSLLGMKSSHVNLSMLLVINT